MIIPKIQATDEKQKEGSFNVLSVDCPPTDNINTATIAMVGEFPGDIEILKKEPFVGPIGSQFNRICAAVRLARYQIYLTTACKAKLPKNNITKLWTEKGWRHPKWGELQAALIDELAEFPGKVIMLLGPTPMRLLIDDPKFDSITKYRGSFYPAEQFPHLKEKLAGKIIGFSFNPSFTTFTGNPVHFYTMIADFTKALKIIDEPELLSDNTELIVQPGFEKVMQFYELIKTKDFVAFDIEATPEFVTCFSLAVYDEDKIKSLCVPLMNNQGSYWTVEEEVKIWKGVAEILEDSNIKKILQNGMFDIMFMLRTMNIKTDSFYFDTMLAQHICYTELPKGLDYLTSVYTYFPYYKDDGKQSHLKVIKDWPSYWTYNAKDSAYLLPITEGLLKELEEFEASDVMEYFMDLHKPLMEMEWNGILTNPDGILTKKKEYEEELISLQKQLDELTGKPLNQGSSKQMIAYFYGICMIKPYVNRKTGNASCDAVALHRIAKKNVKGSAEARIIIKMRKIQKLVSTYFNVPVDDDNRLRCSHKISGTVSGRIATERTYFGTGTNLQNQPYVFKYFLIADPDYLLCEVDLAKAEAHVVAYLSQDTNMIESFTSGIDIHSFNASKIFNVPIEQVIAEHKAGGEEVSKRFMGKKVVHACVDDQTEVLTPGGWINIKNAIGKPILTHANIFDYPRKWNQYRVKEQLILIQGNGLNQFVTFNHRIPIVLDNKCIMVEAKELFGLHNKKLKIIGENKLLEINHITSHKYEGLVYCPTIDFGMFYIRRKGFISVTGNSNYAMGPQTFSDNLAKEEVFMNQGECKRLLNNYSDRFPGLKRWHRSIEEEVQGSRVLYDLFGKPRRFLSDMNAALFRNAYSYKPQSTVAGLLNRGMIKASNDSRLGKEGFDLRFLTTVHDSFVFQFHKDHIPNLLQILMIIKDHMTHTFTHKGKSFTIGLDAKIGTQWAGNTAEIGEFTQSEIDKAIKKIGF